MLLNAFKSIYKQAYVKGIASAVVLTAGLAVGQANAGDIASLTDWQNTETDFINISGDTSDSFNTLRVEGSGSDIVIDAGVTITSNSSGQSYIRASGNDLTITSKGSLNYTSAAESQNLVIGSGSGTHETSVTFAGINIAAGTDVDVLGGDADGKNTSLASTEDILIAGNMDVTAGSSGDATLSGDKSLTISGVLNLTSTANAAASATARVINLGTAAVTTAQNEQNAKIVMTSGASAGFIEDTADAHQYEKSTVHNIYGDAQYDLSAQGNISGASLNIYGGSVILDSTTNNKTSSINVADGVMTAGKIQIASGDTLNFTLEDIQNGVDEDDSATYAEKTFTVNGGTIDVAGTLALSGGSTNGEAVFDLSSDDINLTATGTGVTAAEISVEGSADNATILKLSAGNLNEYLATSEGAAAGTDTQGSVEVKQYGVLELTGDVDLDALTFGTAGSAAAGEVGVAQNAILKVGDVTLDSDISDGDKFSGSLAASNLTLNTGNSDRTDLQDFLGTNSDGIIVSDSLTVTGANTFTLNANALFDTGETYAGENGGLTGTITAESLLVSGGNVTVKGKWDADTDITVSGSSTHNLYVGSGGYAELDMSGQTLTLGASGALTVKGEAGTAEQDKSATLDISSGTLAVDQTGISEADKNAKIEVLDYGTLIVSADDLEALVADPSTDTSGATVLVSGSANADGTLAVNEDLELAFEDLGSTTGANKINVSGHGVLEVNGTLTLENPAEAAAGNLAVDGTVRADSLVINDLKSQADGRKTDPATNGSVTISKGTYEIAGDITSVNDTLVISGSAANAAATLNLAADGTASVEPDLQISGGAAKASVLNIKSGEWTLAGVTVASGSMTVGEDAPSTTEASSASVEADSLTLSNVTGSVNIVKDSSAVFDTAYLTEGGAGKIDVDGTLTFRGEVQTDEGGKVTGYGVSLGTDVVKVNNNATLTLGDTALKGMLEDGKYNTDFGSVDGQQGSKVVLDYADNSLGAMKADEAQTILEGLLGAEESDGYLIDGVVSTGNRSLEGVTVTNNQIEWDDVKMWAQMGFTNDALEQASVTKVNGTDTVKGSFGSLTMGEGEGSTVTAGNLILGNAAGNTVAGNFVTGADGKVGNIDVANGQFVTLAGGGNIGDVELQSGSSANGYDTVLNVNNTDSSVTVINSLGVSQEFNDGTSAVANINGGTTTVTEDITGLAEVNVNGALNVGGDIDAGILDIENGSVISLGEGRDQGDVTVEGLYLSAGTSLVTNVLTFGSADNPDTSFDEAVYGHANSSFIEGSVTAQDIKVQDNLVIAGGSVSADAMTVDADSMVIVGVDSLPEDDESTTEIDESAFSASGLLTVGTLTLNGTLVVDPEWSEPTAYAVFERFDDAVNREDIVGTADGSVFVGKNAVAGAGFSDVADVQALVSEATGGAGLSENGITSMLVLGKPMSVSANGEIVLTSERYDDFQDATPAHTNNYLGSTSAIVVDMDTLVNEDGTLNTALTFEGGDVTIDAPVDEDGNNASVIITGDYTPGTVVSIFNDDENNGVNIAEGGTVTVQSANGFWEYDLEGDNTGDRVTLDVDREKARGILSGASEPVYRHLMAYATGLRNFDADTTAEGYEPQHVYAETRTVAADATAEQIAALTEAGFTDVATNSDGSKVYAKAPSSEFLNRVLSTGNGADAESVARLAVYGGAAEVALAASSVTSDAIASRMGMGNPNGNLVMADNEKGAGLWLAPVYKNHESDDFDAEGVNYGVDLDLTGVALGADYTFGSNLRAGAMFSVGSGDADGQGAGSAVSNDFDFWSVGVYGGYAYEAFSLTADLSWTQVDNDIDANTAAAGKVSASMDADVLSAGLTAKYDFDLDMVKVAPHLGMRYTSIDIDDYTVSDIASSDVDSISVFSIPAGVTFSTEIASASGWNVKPALDLTVTLNTGDDEVDSDVRFNGVDMTTDLTSEFIDDVTYGATVGVQVQKDAFQFGLGVNYTGSDNTDEFGVGANARFTF